MASILSFYNLRRFESARHLINVKDQAKDQATKIIADLFKSAILKKNKDAFDEELFASWSSVSAQQCKMTRRKHYFRFREK